jgi:hypothetical protein
MNPGSNYARQDGPGKSYLQATARIGYFGHHFFIDFPRHRLTSKWTIVTFNIRSCGRTMNASKRVGKRINRFFQRPTMVHYLP